MGRAAITWAGMRPAVPSKASFLAARMYAQEHCLLLLLLEGDGGCARMCPACWNLA